MKGLKWCSLVIIEDKGLKTVSCFLLAWPADTEVRSCRVRMTYTKIRRKQLPWVQILIEDAPVHISAVCPSSFQKFLQESLFKVCRRSYGNKGGRKSLLCKPSSPRARRDISPKTVNNQSCLDSVLFWLHKPESIHFFLQLWYLS